jgi:hypothetical protein
MNVETKAQSTSTEHRTDRWSLIAVFALVLLIVVASFGYARMSHASSEQTLSGQAYVGMNQASVSVDGWTYGFTPSTTRWFDAQGTMHEGDVAAPCLRSVGTHVRITFGEVPVSGLQGTSWREVVWVRCG